MRAVFATFLVVTCSAFAVVADFTEKDVIGQWYRGDHFGYNLVLTLSSDHTYKARWTGDEIDPKTNKPESYGSASGKWKLEANRLVILPTTETKDTKGDLSTLRLERRRGKVVLAPTRPPPVPTMFHLDPMMVFERQTK